MIEHNIINVINLESRPERLGQFHQESLQQKFGYRVWPGIVFKGDPKRGINLAHRQIVQFAKDNYMPFIIIAEDDILFMSKVREYETKIKQLKEKDANYAERKDYLLSQIELAKKEPTAWQYFLDNIPEDCDIFLGMWYACDLVEGNRIMDAFSGMTLYLIRERFYDFFLGLPESIHIDRELGKHANQFKILFADQIVCEQDGSYSSNVKTTVGLAGYRSFLKGRKIFGDVEL